MAVATGGLDLSAYAQGTRMGRVRMGLTVTPRRVPADDQSLARVRVDLRDSGGRPVADGTQVVVHTDLGFLTTTRSDRVTTASLDSRGGFVSFWVVSDRPGTAILTITVEDSRQQALVDFTPPGETRIEETRVVHLSGGWTGYALDLGLAEARDNATARFGRVRLEGADFLQLDAEGMILRGGPGRLTDGERTLEGSDFYLELHTRRGVLRRLGPEGVERIIFDLYTLEPRESAWEVPPLAFVPDTAESIAWLLAEEVIVFSQEKVVIRGGALYTDRAKVMDLPPIYIVALPGYTGASNSQVLSVNSGGALSVSLPYFVGVSETSTTAVRLEKGTQASRVGARRDWSLGLAHEYRFAEVDGSIELSGLPLRDWGLNWRDSRALGRVQADFNFAWPDHRSLFLDGNLYTYGGGHSFNLRSYYSHPAGLSDSFGVTGEWLTDPRSLGPRSGMHYRLGTSLGLEKSAFLQSDRTEFVNEVYGYLDWMPIRLSPRTRVTPSLSDVYRWDTAGYQGNTLRSELRLDHMLGPMVDLSLRYNASHSSGDRYFTGWRQLLSTDLRAYHGTKWMAYLSGSLDLGEGDWYGYASWDYNLDRDWRVMLLGAWYNLAGMSYNDQEVYLGRRLFQNREIGLSWSRQTGRISLELLGLATTF